MGRALAALICIRLDARQGESVAVTELAHYLGVTPAQVTTHLEQMQFDRLVDVSRDAAGDIVAARTPDLLHPEAA